MITAHDINAITFEKAVRGYRTETVDKLLDDVASQLEADATEILSLKKAIELEKENECLLAQKIEEYRLDEDNLKSALLNAQRMGENVIREANQKAEMILHDAQARGDVIIEGAKMENKHQRDELRRIKAEVTQFKEMVLSLYKEHVASLQGVPEDKSTEEESVEMAVVSEQDEVVVPPETLAQTTPEWTEAPSVALESESQPVITTEMEIEQPVVLTAQEQAESAAFWEQDEHTLTENASIFEAFKGIKFSD